MYYNPNLIKSAPVADRVAAQSLVMEILNNNGCVTVNDGEEDVVEKSCRFISILDAMASTDEDLITVYDETGKERGYFCLIYNNGSEFDPMVLISDYSANDYCEYIYNRVNAVLGGSDV